MIPAFSWPKGREVVGNIAHLSIFELFLLSHLATKDNILKSVTFRFPMHDPYYLLEHVLVFVVYTFRL